MHAGEYVKTTKRGQIVTKNSGYNENARRRQWTSDRNIFQQIFRSILLLLHISLMCYFQGSCLNHLAKALSWDVIRPITRN